MPGLSVTDPITVPPPLGAGAPAAADLQAGLFTFAIGELVRQHRESFQPLWSTESWAKLLIWLALNSGCSGDQASLEAFAAALGPALSARLRRLYFERELDDLGLRLLADPAEAEALVLPVGAAQAAPELEHAAAAVEQAGLARLLGTDRTRWRRLESAVAIPWAAPAPASVDLTQP